MKSSYTSVQSVLCRNDTNKSFFVEIFRKKSDECHKRKEHIMVEKDYKLYGTKILNLKTQEIGLLICLWENKFADKTVDFATCVDKPGRRYNIELDNIRGLEDDF